MQYEKLFIYVVIGIVISLVVYCLMNCPKEKFVGGPSMAAVPVYGGILPSGNYVSVPNYLAAVTPRMQGMANVGSSIRYNPPASKYLAVPEDPLLDSNRGQQTTCKGLQQRYLAPKPCSSTLVVNEPTPKMHNALSFEDMVTEGYACESCHSSSCGGNCQSKQVGLPSLDRPCESRIRLTNACPSSQVPGGLQDYPEVTSMLPIGDMTMLSSTGEELTPHIYTQYIAANRRSRLRSQGDMIRGDLAIAPCTGNKWFQVSVQPSLDLQQGAMNVMGGMYNETAGDLTKFIHAASGNSTNTIAGSLISNEFLDKSGFNSRDVNVTAFP